jgi:hypothetical protein
MWEIQGTVIGGISRTGGDFGSNSTALSPDRIRTTLNRTAQPLHIWKESSYTLASIGVSDGWSMDGNGWIVDREKKRLIWVPPDLRTGLIRPRNTAIMYRRGSLELSFEGALLGPRWRDCYLR